MSTLQNIIETETLAAASAVKFKGSDAQKEYAVAVLWFSLCKQSMVYASRRNDWRAEIVKEVKAQAATHKVRGGVDAGAFLSRNTAIVHARGETPVAKIWVNFDHKLNAEILNAEV